jgi:multicomponent K+:H+ antiporter subunit D
VVLISSLMTMIALVRAGSALFWKNAGKPPDAAAAERLGLLLPAAGLLLASPLLVLLAGAVTAFTGAAAQQLIDPSAYIESVLPGSTETTATAVAGETTR